MDAKIKTIAAWLDTGSINIFGRPFSGKDTQGRILAGMFGGVLIGGGDILRNHHDPAHIEKIMASGGIIPSAFYESIVLPYLSRPEFKTKPLILSAVGRASGEEPVVMKAAGNSGHPLKAVLLLQLSEEDVWRRCELLQIRHDRGNRADDQRDVLKTRLQKFRDKTMPVIQFYQQRGLLLEIDAARLEQEVTGEIIKALAGRASR